VGLSSLQEIEEGEQEQHGSERESSHHCCLHSIPWFHCRVSRPGKRNSEPDLPIAFYMSISAGSKNSRVVWQGHCGGGVLPSWIYPQVSHFHLIGVSRLKTVPFHHLEKFLIAFAVMGFDLGDHAE
jgi:hypothetical protein